MKITAIIATIIIGFAFALVFASSPEDSMPGIVDLTSSNVESVLDGSKHVLVEFYAPWCGHCKTLAPEMQKVGDVLQKQRPSDIVVAKVNCDAHADVCSKYQVRGYPTIKFFPKGSQEAEDYNKGRTQEDIINFLNDKCASRLRVEKPISHVVDLTPENFDSVVMNADKDVLVEFYAPWCGHCKRLTPVYEKLAHAFRLDSDKVVVARVDADAHRELGQRFGVSGFPTIKFFPRGTADKTPEAYALGRTLDDFLGFLNDKKDGLKRTESGHLDDTAGRTEALDALAKKFVEDAEKREEIAKEADGANGHYYVKVMKNVLSKGDEYVSKEKARLQRLLESNAVNDKMLDSLKTRINILTAFE